MLNLLLDQMLKHILYLICLNPSRDSNDEFSYLIAFYKDQIFTLLHKLDSDYLILMDTEKTLPSILKKKYPEVFIRIFGTRSNEPLFLGKAACFL